MDAFGTVVVVVAIAGAVVAVLSYVGSGALYRDIGRGGLSLDQSEGPRPGTEAYRRESEAELRQLLEAKSYRRQARGEPALDVDAELRALSRAPAAGDPGLEAEVRELVVASNERRLRRGEPPLDVDAEVARRMREFGA